MLARGSAWRPLHQRATSRRGRPSAPSLSFQIERLQIDRPRAGSQVRDDELAGSRRLGGRGSMDATALITGGTGGLGTAVTKRFLGGGWRVVVPWLVPAELDRVERHPRLELVEAALFDTAPVARCLQAAPSYR